MVDSLRSINGASRTRSSSFRTVIQSGSVVVLRNFAAIGWGLWCRVWDTGVISVESEYELTTEAGFTRKLRICTWRDHVKQLASSGFT